MAGMEESTTLEWTAQAHPRRVLILWNCLFFLSIILLAAALQALITLNLIDYQKTTCPAGSFITSLTDWGSAIAYAPWVPVSIVASALTVPALFRRLPWTGARHAGGSRRNGRHFAQTPLYMRLGLLSATLILALPLTAYKATSGVCVWPQGFSHRASSFDTPSIHAWSEVRKLSAACIPSRSGYRMDLSVETANGHVVDLAPSRSPEELTRQYARLAQALDGVNYAYDARHLDYCPPEVRAILQSPPRR